MIETFPSCCDLTLCKAATRIEEIYDATPVEDKAMRRALRQAHRAVLAPLSLSAYAGYLEASAGDGDAATWTAEEN